MDRNFFRRVEVAFPILESALRARIVKEALETYLADNTQAWLLQSDGSYVRTTSGDAQPLTAQTTLLKELAETP